jgi:hypothetical protein
VTGPADAAHPEWAIARGGGYRDEGLALALSNRAIPTALGRYGPTGIRLCADLPR